MIRVRLPFNLLIAVQFSIVDAEKHTNYVSITLFKQVPIYFTIDNTIINSKKKKLIQLFSIGFRYRRHRIIVNL